MPRFVAGDDRGQITLSPLRLDDDGARIIRFGAARAPRRLQGNLDRRALIAGGDALDRSIDDVLANCAKGRLIFNPGPGNLRKPRSPMSNGW